MKSTLSMQAIAAHRKRVGRLVFILGVGLVIGWPIAIAVSWEHIVSSHTRLGYLIGDIGLVTPLCFAAWYGLTRGRAWGPLVFLILVGALAYDIVHFGIYLIQEEFLSIPTPIYIFLILLILGILYWLARWEVIALTSQENQPRLE